MSRRSLMIAVPVMGVLAAAAFTFVEDRKRETEYLALSGQRVEALIGMLTLVRQGVVSPKAVTGNVRAGNRMIAVRPRIDGGNLTVSIEGLSHMECLNLPNRMARSDVPAADVNGSGFVTPQKMTDGLCAEDERRFVPPGMGYRTSSIVGRNAATLHMGNVGSPGLRSGGFIAMPPIPQMGGYSFSVNGQDVTLDIIPF